MRCRANCALIALGRYGFDLDLQAAHPHVKLSMIPIGKAAAVHFLTHREEILAGVGERLFPALTRGEHRAEAKMLFSSLDMDGTLAGFLVRQQIPPLHPSVLNMTLRDGSIFDMERYMDCQADGTQWLWDHMGHDAPGCEGSTGMGGYVERWMRKHRPEKLATTPAARTMKSFCFQESESYGRMAMARWAEEQGHVCNMTARLLVSREDSRCVTQKWRARRLVVSPVDMSNRWRLKPCHCPGVETHRKGAKRQHTA